MWAAVSWVINSNAARRVGSALALFAAALALIWEMRRSTKKNVKLEAEVDRLKGAAEADERMDHADTGNGASDADNRDWLRERGSRRSKPRP